MVHHFILIICDDHSSIMDGVELVFLRIINERQQGVGTIYPSIDRQT